MPETETESEVSFETITEERHEYGNNNILFISYSRAIPADGEPTEFVQIRKCFESSKDGKLYTDSYVSIPTRTETMEWTIENLQSVLETIQD